MNFPTATFSSSGRALKWSVVTLSDCELQHVLKGKVHPPNWNLLVLLVLHVAEAVKPVLASAVQIAHKLCVAFSCRIWAFEVKVPRSFCFSLGLRVQVAGMSL